MTEELKKEWHDLFSLVAHKIEGNELPITAAIAICRYKDIETAKSFVEKEAYDHALWLIYKATLSSTIEKAVYRPATPPTTWGRFKSFFARD